MREKKTRLEKAKRFLLAGCVALYAVLFAYVLAFPPNQPMQEVSSASVMETPIPVLLPTLPPDAVAEEKPVQTLNLNAVDAWMLCAVPGIGDELAERIVSYREQVGGFVELSELRRISGIGESTYQRISAYLHCGEAE